VSPNISINVKSSCDTDRIHKKYMKNLTQDTVKTKIMK